MCYLIESPKKSPNTLKNMSMPSGLCDRHRSFIFANMTKFEQCITFLEAKDLGARVCFQDSFGSDQENRSTGLDINEAFSIEQLNNSVLLVKNNITIFKCATLPGKFSII